MTAEARTTTPPATARPTTGSSRRWRSLLTSTEIDVRLFGMLLALALIWVGFDIRSGGNFLTARNLWNLSVQSASIAIMACGMVLVIVSRNIDLSVGSMLGFLGYTMAMVQTEWIPNTFELGFGRWYTWIVAVAVGVVLGAVIAGVQGFVVAYVGVPSFIVTLGGCLVWRGLIFSYQQGQTIAPMDSTFQLLGGGTRGSLGEWRSWLLVRSPVLGSPPAS
jgi:D-xylose transport system permease protein